MDQENKLKKFENAVFQEIETKIAEMHNSALAYEEEELEINVNAQLAKSYLQIQAQVQEIRRNARREVAKFSLVSKRDILKKRISLMEQAFDNVKVRLREYMKTDEYKKNLLSEVSSLTKSQAGLTNVKLFVAEQDFSFATELKAACAVPCEVEKDAQIKCGGFILRDDNACLYFDETLETKLYDQKSYFIENSGLAL